MNFKISAASCFTLLLLGLMSISTPYDWAVTATEIVSQGQIARLGEHDVIYLGENHDRLEHHQAQLSIITQLQLAADANKDLVIAWEMFQRPFQPVLDRYLSGNISEIELRQQTEYDTRWGFDWEYYAPILRFAKVQQIPLLALNTPEEITRKVAETGLDSLQIQDFQYIPAQAEIKLEPVEYRQKMQDIYQDHLEMEQGNSSDIDNFFAAQVLWDETMAEAIANYYQSYPQSQIVVLVGFAHVMNDYAIPDRVARRIESASFKQTTLLLPDSLLPEN